MLGDGSATVRVMVNSWHSSTAQPPASGSAAVHGTEVDSPRILEICS